MSLLAKPTPAEINQFLVDQRSEDYSYSAVGGTRSRVPDSFDVDGNRVWLGRGQAAYSAACEAVRKWQMFPVGWTEIQPADAAQQPGETLAPASTQ